LRSQRLFFPKDLRIIATVWWLSFFPNLDGVDKAFRVILRLSHAIRTRDLAPLSLSFGFGPLLSLLANVILGLIDCR